MWYALNMNARQLYLIDQEVSRLQACIYHGTKHRTTHAVAKALLLKGDYFYDGIYLTPCVKSVGCGVYDVWAKEANVS